MSDSEGPESPAFEHKKVAFKRKQPEPDSDDSDDSDIQVQPSVSHSRTNCSLQAQLLDISDDSDADIIDSKAITQKSKSAVEQALDSDDEADILPATAQDSCVYMNTKGHLQSLQHLQRARQAQLKLRLAQAYHAEDVHIPLPTPKSIPIPTILVRPTQTALTSSVTLGRTISVKMRTTKIINNKRSNQQLEDLMEVKELELIQNLVDRYRNQKGLSQGTKIIFRFENDIMDVTKTPQFYDLDDDELIDVEFKTLVVFASTTGAIIPQKHGVAAIATPIRIELGQALFVNLRTVNATKQVSTDVFKTYENEPFRALMDRYRKMKGIAESKVIQFIFEDALKMDQTPADVDMESEETIDVKIK